VVRVWRPASARRPRGTFRSLLDNGVRCITHPCFSIQAVALNQERVANVSEVDVSATGASASERRWARTRMATRHLIAAGKVVRKPNAGPAGTGRVFLASQIYFPARPH
jgi:hypothetical protein